MNVPTGNDQPGSPSDFSGFELRLPDDFEDRKEHLVEFTIEKPNSYEVLYGKHGKGEVDGIIEKYPHLVEALIRRWGDSNEMEAYLRGLVINDRGTNRKWFEHGLLKELSWLKGIHDEVYGKPRLPENPLARDIPGADQWDSGFLR